MENLLIFLIILTPFLGVMCVGCFVADYILPHIKPLERWLETLPMMEDDDDE